MGNVGAGIAIGIAVGVAVGASFSSKKSDQDRATRKKDDPAD